VQALQAHLALDAPAESSADGALVVLLSEAAARGQSVSLRYRSERGEETERVVDPYGVVAAMRSWYLVGYCQLRQGLRLFRLDRIQHAAPGEERFAPPADFDTLGYVLPRIAAWGGSGAVEVLLGLSMAQARRKVPPGTSILEPDRDGVTLRTQARDLDGLARFLLGLGCPLTVREPPALKDALRRVAREITHIAESA
jgi:predicted DNA-binding transcriptional regulator YafY